MYNKGCLQFVRGIVKILVWPASTAVVYLNKLILSHLIPPYLAPLRSTFSRSQGLNPPCPDAKSLQSKCKGKNSRREGSYCTAPKASREGNPHHNIYTQTILGMSGRKIYLRAGGLSNSALGVFQSKPLKSVVSLIFENFLSHSISLSIQLSMSSLHVLDQV